MIDYTQDCGHGYMLSRNCPHCENIKLRDSLAEIERKTAETILNLCKQRVLAIDPAHEIIAAIRERYGI